MDTTTNDFFFYVSSPFRTMSIITQQNFRHQARYVDHGLFSSLRFRCHLCCENQLSHALSLCINEIATFSLITLIFFFLFSFSLNLQRFWHIQSIVFSTFSVELFFVSSSFFCILWEDCPAFINIYDDSFYITVQNSSYFFITIWLCFFIFGLEFGSHLSLF